MCNKLNSLLYLDVIVGIVDFSFLSLNSYFKNNSVASRYIFLICQTVQIKQKLFYKNTLFHLFLPVVNTAGKNQLLWSDLN